MRFWGKGPTRGHSASSEAKNNVGMELDPEGPPREPPERKKVSSVLFVRSAIMAMLAIFLAAVALVAFFLAKESLTSQVDRLGSLVRSGILNRTVERLNVQLDEGSRCVTTLEKVLVSVWTQQNVSTQNQKSQADASAWFSFGGCGAISGAGWVRPDGTNSFYQALLDDTNVEATTSNITQYTFINASIPVSGEFSGYRQLLNASTHAPLTTAVPTYPPIDMRNYAWYVQARDSVDRMGYVVFVNPNGRPALVQSRRVVDLSGKFLGEAFVMQYLSDLSTYLAAIPLGGGYLYVTNNSIILADSFGIPILTQQDNSTLNSLAPNKSSVAPVRDAANFLTSKLGPSLGNVSAAFKDVHLGGGTYSLDVLTFSYKTLNLRAVVIIPRSLIMGSIDRKTRIAIAVIVGVTVGITLIGFGLVCLFTGRVSREFQLRLALVQQLNARKQAEARSETKSRFLANMSHELRTPMAGIIGLLDILLADELTVEQELNLIQIKQCATSLLGLLNDVLDLEKIEAGKMTLAAEEFDLGATLESLVDLFAVQCLGKGIEIGLDLPDTVECTVRGDAARVRQIFSNLISNSIKFTKTGYLVVRCWEESPDAAGEAALQTKESISPPHSGSLRRDSAGEPRRVRLFFEVEDTGTGIPADKRESVFESFVQADPSSTRLYGGSGLGLGITRSLVQMMGGKIAILDKDGPGTLIRFDLVFEAPRKSNSSCTSFRLSPERALPTSDAPTAGNAGDTAGDDGKGGDGFFSGLGKRKQRSRSPGDEAWLEGGLGYDPTSPRALEEGLGFNPMSPGDDERGRSRQRSFDTQLGLLAKSARGGRESVAAKPPHPLVRALSAIEPPRLPAGGASEAPGVKTFWERQPAPGVSESKGIPSDAAIVESVFSVRRSVVLGVPGVLGRGLAKEWLEKHGYATTECEEWIATMAALKRVVAEAPLEESSAGALQQGVSERIEGPARPDELLVILDIDLLKDSGVSPRGQSPTAKLAGLRELLYQHQKARVDWAAKQGETRDEQRGSKPVRVAVGWLVETTTPSAMRHFLSRLGFPIKVGKPLYPTRLQKLVKMLTDAVAEPPTLDVTPPGEFPAPLPPLVVGSLPENNGRTPPTDFFRMGGGSQGRTLPLEVQADLAKHQIDGALSWSFFDNRGARAPIPVRPANSESEPQSWSTSPSGTMTSSGAKESNSSSANSPSGGLEPGAFAPPERTISLSIDIPEFSPPHSPHRKEDRTSPDSNFAFYLEGEPSPLSATEPFPSASDRSNASSEFGSGALNPALVLASLNKSSSFASSSSYDTLLRSQSSGVSSQSSADEYPRGFRGLGRGAMSDKLSPTDRLSAPSVQEPISELEDAGIPRSSSPSPEISPVTPIVTSAFASPSLVTALRQSGSSSSLAPAKESPGGESAKSFDGPVWSPKLVEEGGSPKLSEMRTASGPIGGDREQESNPVHRRSASAQIPGPAAKTSPEQATPKVAARRSPPILPLSVKALQGLRILVAEDTPVLQRLAVTLLTKLGAEVVAVDNGRFAVEAVARTMPRGTERLMALGLVLGGRQDESSGSETPPRIGAALPPGGDWSGESDRSPPQASGSEIEEAGGKARAFDCLLMDCQMPQMDGYDATKAIRRLEMGTGSHLPILALTAHAMVEDEQKCLAAGMDSYLTKPIVTKLLVSTIKKLIGVGRVERLSR